MPICPVCTGRGHDGRITVHGVPVAPCPACHGTGISED